jgi:hypothetical protein
MLNSNRFFTWQRFAQLALCLLLSIIHPANNQLSAQAVYTPEQLQNHFERVATAYAMEIEGKPVTFRSKPLMNWFNSERQQDRGALYVWEQQGKPVVLGSIFTFEYDSQVLCRHEMISLADGPLTATLDSIVVWNPLQSGMDWRPIEQPATAATSANRRLIEMRSIARQFSGELKIPNAQPSKLTLLPQPLHRYQAPEQGVIDGAIFSFAVGTDPEILLVIEANDRDGKSGYRVFSGSGSLPRTRTSQGRRECLESTHGNRIGNDFGRRETVLQPTLFFIHTSPSTACFRRIGLVHVSLSTIPNCQIPKRPRLSLQVTVYPRLVHDCPERTCTRGRRNRRFNVGPRSPIQTMAAAVLRFGRRRLTP